MENIHINGFVQDCGSCMQISMAECKTALQCINNEDIVALPWAIYLQLLHLLISQWFACEGNFMSFEKIPIWTLIYKIPQASKS